MSTISTSKGPHPLLVKYLAELALHPLRTKSITTGTLCFLQEVLGSNLAGTPVKVSKDSSHLVRVLARAHVDTKAVKMAIYGFLVSAPLSHVLIGLLQRAFAGKTSVQSKIAQILASSLLISPIQTSAFLGSMAIINGATSLDEVVKTVRAGFFSVIRISWVVSPLSMSIAQKFIPVDLWVPFFNAIQFVLGTYFNVRVKQLKLAAARKEKLDREAKEKDRKE
ncbi:hypothetical protein CVT25_005661 [Psilocybe cyanescens]|uniref:Uncharacterized protein n=1 Tax=Psilocybe cyanescens TaxID=93625 RepID=A0A409VLC4_PSICY|nr:hypothetical protein CVT25_005661 [Psilocybe cyanescens]